jgi:nucleotide-binding universal stress UspA family protein
MINFTRILFPVDLSTQSREAAPFVAAMATRFQSELFVLHVLQPELAYYPIPAAATPAALKHDREMRKAKKTEFQLFVSKQFGGIPIQSELVEGDPADCIISCAQEKNVDLTMMPTHGYGRFRRLLLGSVTAKVLHDLPCPVWTAVHTAEIWSHVSRDWRRFLCAVDDNIRDLGLLQWAAQFAFEQHAELQLIHAVSTPASIPGESDLLYEALNRQARENLSGLQCNAGTSVEITLGFGPVWRVVRDAAVRYRADLILIGRGAIQEGFGRLRSNAYAVIREAPCPVISVSREDPAAVNKL